MTGLVRTCPEWRPESARTASPHTSSQSCSSLSPASEALPRGPQPRLVAATSRDPLWLAADQTAPATRYCRSLAGRHSTRSSQPRQHRPLRGPATPPPVHRLSDRGCVAATGTSDDPKAMSRPSALQLFPDVPSASYVILDAPSASYGFAGFNGGTLADNAPKRCGRPFSTLPVARG